MTNANKQVLSAVTTTANGTAIPTYLVYGASCQAVATGTIAGTLKLQVSNDPASGNVTPTNWTDLSGATVPITGTAGTFLIPYQQLCYQWVRAVFTASGGTGTLTANMTMQGV
jgi:hypothetical protein